MSLHLTRLRFFCIFIIYSDKSYSSEQDIIHIFYIKKFNINEIIIIASSWLKKIIYSNYHLSSHIVQHEHTAHSFVLL